VAEVHKSGRLAVATADVTEFIKGERTPPKITFIASPRGIEDESRADVDEEAIVFLESVPRAETESGGATGFVIANSGRAKFPIKRFGAVSYAMVRSPKGAEVGKLNVETMETQNTKFPYLSMFSVVISFDRGD
jgi:hypothetical protein